MRKIFSILLLCFMAGNVALAEDDAMVIGMPNPASVYCEDNDGTNKIMTSKNGGQYSLCIFENLTSCEEWSFMRGECKNEGEYINTKLYAALLKQETQVRKMLDGISKDTLDKAATSIEKLIENTKLLRITQEAQKQRITQLVFLRYIMVTESANK